MTDERLLKSVGKRIRQLRRERRLTQEEAAKLAGIDYKYYQRIEYGEKNLSLTTMNKLSKAFNVPAFELIKIEATR